MQRWMKMWRWAWWWAKPPRSARVPGEMPHPPYYGDKTQMADRDYQTKQGKGQE